MLVPGSANPLLLRTVAAPSGGVSRSLRFNAPDSAYLSRTPASAGNRKTFTFACWVKLTKITGYCYAISAGPDSNTVSSFSFSDNGNTAGLNELNFFDYQSGAYTTRLISTAVFRDPSSWYHVVLAVDTTQSTAGNRVKIYVNGTQLTSFTTATYPNQNTDLVLNNNVAHLIGTYTDTKYRYSDAYQADVYFIDGQALDPSSFTTTDATTGQLIPKAFSGSYGTNGWHLDFADNSAATATTLGKDSAGSNNWTPNNFSVTAGAGNDSLVDVPTNGSQVDSGIGNEVRGNYCTWNPVANFNGSTLSNGNLDVVTPGAAGGGAVFGTIAIPSSGKWYWEVVVTSSTLPSQDIAFAGITKPINGIYQNRSTTAYAEIYFLGGGIGGTVFSSTGSRTNGAEINVGDVCGIAVDRDNGAIYFYKNGVANGSVTGFTFVDGMFPYVEDNSGGSGQSSITANFGQRPFAYPVAGYKCLNSASLPAPLVTKPNTVMDAVLYTGTGAVNNITGLAFNPDLVWIKARSIGYDHRIADSVRGVGNELYSNNTSAETANDANGYVSAFNSGGFTLQAGIGVNRSGYSFVGWCWDAGTSTVTNTQGSITSSVRANPTAGFSIVSYTSVGTSTSLDTIGHGLGVAPSLAFIKNRDLTDSWWVYSSLFSNPAQDYLILNGTDAKSTFGSTTYSASSTTIGIRQGLVASSSGQRIIVYAFAPVVGYSSFGVITSNGTSDNAFAYLGFRPRFLLYKNASATGNWGIYDSSRDPENVCDNLLLASTSNAEFTSVEFDFLSNGIKLRYPYTNGNQIVFAAFAESPFNYARAR